MCAAAQKFRRYGQETKTVGGRKEERKKKKRKVGETLCLKTMFRLHVQFQTFKNSEILHHIVWTPIIYV